MMNENLFSRIEARSPADRGRLLMDTDTGARYVWADLDRVTAGYAGMLHDVGLKPGDRLAVLVDKSPESLFLYLACLRLGLVYMPLNPAYRREELAYLFTDAQPALVVGRPGYEKALAGLLPANTRLYTLGTAGEGSLPDAAADAAPFERCRPARRDDVAAIVYTSGTTGRPKGAMISHGNLVSNAAALVDVWRFTGDDVLLHVLPLFHVHGLFVACHCVLWCGGRMRFLQDAGVENIRRHLDGATVMMGVPTHYTRLLCDERFDRNACRSIRLFISGSAPLLPQTFEAFERRTGHRILERYGMTETGMNTSNPLEGLRKPGTVGPPLPGVQVRIVNPAGGVAAVGVAGVLEVKGPNVFKGYWRQPGKSAEAFTKDGWFITGDLASFDEDGYVRIEGRQRDLIISGGYNVYPKEVELCLDGMPGVAESAVIGVPHADYGEAVSAVVVTEPGAALTEASVIEYVKQRLAAYKAPKSVHFVDEVPRNTMGKVQKNVLKERLTDYLATSPPPEV